MPPDREVSRNVFDGDPASVGGEDLLLPETWPAQGTRPTSVPDAQIDRDGSACPPPARAASRPSGDQRDVCTRIRSGSRPAVNVREAISSPDEGFPSLERSRKAQRRQRPAVGRERQALDLGRRVSAPGDFEESAGPHSFLRWHPRCGRRGSLPSGENASCATPSVWPVNTFVQNGETATSYRREMTRDVAVAVSDRHQRNGPPRRRSTSPSRARR